MRSQPSIKKSMDVNAAGEDEERRLAVVRALGLPHSAHASPQLEALCTKLASQLGLTHCLVGIAGRVRVDVVAAYGADIKSLDGADPRSSFFLWPLPTARADMVVVEDVSQDMRFAAKHWVRTTGAKYYVAVALVASSGAVIGFLVGISNKKAVRLAEDYHMLANFAELAVRELESSGLPALQDMAEQEGASLLRSPDESEQPVLLCEVTSRWWNIEYADRYARKLHPTMETAGIPFWGVFTPVSGAKNMAQKQVAADIEHGRDFVLQVKLRDQQGSQKPLTIRFKSANSCNLANPSTTVQVPQTVAMNGTATNVKHTRYFGLIELPDAPLNEQADGQVYTLVHPQLSKGRNSAPGLADVKVGVACYSSNLIRVYRSYWNREPVALKVMAVKPEQCVPADDGFTLVPREAVLATQLVHHNIIPTYKVAVRRTLADCTTELYRKGEPVVMAEYVREWCPYGDLQSLMDAGAFFEADKETPKLELIIAVAQDLAAGMHYLHSQHVIGATLHPKSILLAADPAAGDQDLKPFIAKIGTLADAVVAEGPVSRSIPPADSILFRYASPELLSKGMASQASDVYSFGKLVWEIYTNGKRECPAGGSDRRISMDFSGMSMDFSSRRSMDFGGRGGGRKSVDFSGRKSVDYGSRRPAEGGQGLEALLKACLASKPQARPSFDAVVDALEVMRGGGQAEALNGHKPSGLLSSMTMKGSKVVPRASFDGGHSVLKTLQPKLGGKLLSRKVSSGHSDDGSVRNGSAGRPPMIPRSSHSLVRKASSSSQDSPKQDAASESNSARSLASRLTGRVSTSSTATWEPESPPKPPSKPKGGLTSRLFGKKLKQVLQSPTKLGVS